MSKEIPYSVQIGEVERELKIRETFYELQIRAGKMKAKDADRQLRIMREVLRTLQRLREQEINNAKGSRA